MSNHYRRGNPETGGCLLGCALLIASAAVSVAVIVLLASMALEVLW